MIFNSRVQQTPKQPGHTWSITAQYLPRDHPQKTTTLKVVDSFKYLGVPIDKDLTMGPLHTLIRDNIQKANGKLQGLLRDLKSSRELHSSHHTTLGRASTSPKTIGLLWKSCVLVHATQYIRYIHSPSHLKTIQTQLNKSLQSTFGCSGLPSTLQAELGIPPLQYYQTKQLASSHFRLTKIHQHALPGQIYTFRTHNLPHLDPIDLENRILQSCKTIFTYWCPSESLPQPKYLEKVLIQNQEIFFGRSLHVPISNIWRLQLRPQPPDQEPTRHNAYVAIAGPDIDRPDLFKPAPYLTADHQISPKCLFRIRTQHTKEIPTHQHLKVNLAGRQLHSNYSDHKCPFCRATPVTGHETHYLLACPSITPGMEPMYKPIKENLRLALPPWDGLDDNVKISLLLGSSLPSQLDKRKAMRDQ